MCRTSTPSIAITTMSTTTTTTTTPCNNNGVSVRCRTRKSSRAIDPEFGNSQETLLSFDRSSNNSGSDQQSSHKRDKQSLSLILTPIHMSLSSIIPRACSSPLRGGCPLPARGRHHSFGAPLPRRGSASSSAGSWNDLGVEGDFVGNSSTSANNDAKGNTTAGQSQPQFQPQTEGGHVRPEGLPPTHFSKKSLSASASTPCQSDPIAPNTNQALERPYPHSSCGTPQSATPSQSCREPRSRSLSRTRTRSERSRSKSSKKNGGWQRKRSIGAHNAFADVPLNGLNGSTMMVDPLSCSSPGTGQSSPLNPQGLDGGVDGWLDESVRSAPGMSSWMRGVLGGSVNSRGSLNDSIVMGEDGLESVVCIPLKDVISIDQDISSSDSVVSLSVGSSVSSLPNSVDTTHANNAMNVSNYNKSNAQNAIPLPPPSTLNGVISSHKNSIQSKNKKHSLYRIFIHTASFGYIEFSFDNSNSFDILLAYLTAHLKNKIRERGMGTRINIGSSNNAMPGPGGGALQTMILTPSKIDHLSSSLGSTSHPRNSPKQSIRLLRTTSLQTTHTFQTAQTTQEVTFDKLEAKAIKRRIQQESTPLERMKENLADWMSQIVDCACCQDTSSIAPEGEDIRGVAPNNGGGYNNSSGGSSVARFGTGRDNKSPRLKQVGIGGLSLEEEVEDPSMGHGAVSPKLSFERSVSSRSSKR